MNLTKSLGSALAVVFIVKYFALSNGHMLAATVDWGGGKFNSLESCELYKIKTDKEPDPPGTSTKLFCVDESDIEKTIRNGEDT